MPRLSIIVLSYNTREVTEQSLLSLFKTLALEKTECEVVVADNGSTDGSVEMLKKLLKTPLPSTIQCILIMNHDNKGFTVGNNAALKKTTGEYVLFLNSDVLVTNVVFRPILDFLDDNRMVGALTVTVSLEDGKHDMAAHRGFPTIWNAFYYFSQLEKLTAAIPYIRTLFGGYHLNYMDFGRIHEVDAISGAFLLTRRSLLTELKGFDEDYFMYGEDIDLCYRIKKKGFSIVYYPTFSVVHLKYKSGLRKEKTKTQHKTKDYFYDAMKIFFDKHYSSSYPSFVKPLIHSLIDLKKNLS